MKRRKQREKKRRGDETRVRVEKESMTISRRPRWRVLVFFCYYLYMLEDTLKLLFECQRPIA
jgi:hypothetical protein